MEDDDHNWEIEFFETAALCDNLDREESKKGYHTITNMENKHKQVIQKLIDEMPELCLFIGDDPINIWKADLWVFRPKALVASEGTFW